MVAAIKKNRNLGLIMTRAPDGGVAVRVQKRMVGPTVRNGSAPGTQAAPPADPAAQPAPTAIAQPVAQPAAQPAARAQPAAQPAAIVQPDTAMVAAVVAEVMRQRQAPAVHTRTGDQFTSRDLELLALDSGMRGEDVDRWRAARTGDLPAIPAGHTRFRRPAGRRQFHQMRGSRSFGPDAVRNGSLGQATGPSEEVGELWASWASYMGRAIKLAGRIAPDLAWKMAQRDGADPILVRALGESTLIDGGALVPEVVLEDYIELLYASTVFLQGNPTRVTLTNGKVTIPRLASGATAYWVGENANITPSQETFDDIELNLRKMALLVPYSNDLANHAITALQALIRDDMSMQAAIAVDTALIRGTGTAYQPRGVRYEAVSTNIVAATAITNIANVTADTTAMMRRQMAFNVKGTKWYWMMSPRTLMYLWGARDAAGLYVWRDELMRGFFNGRPYGVTTSIPETLGSGGDTELYLVDMAHELYGEGAGIDGYKFDVRDGEAYYNGSTVVSGYSQDQSVARLIQKCDRVSRQNGKDVSVLTGVTWA